MTIEDKLTFCQVCSNRKFNSQIGTFCGLTNEKPTFEHLCPDFQVDSHVREERERDLHSRVTTNKVSERYTYPTSDRAINKLLGKLPDSRIIRRSKMDSWAMILVFPVLSVVFIYSYPIGEQGTEKLITQPLFYLLAIPGILLSIYGIHHLKNKSPKITLTKKEITLHELEMTIPWWLILRTALYQEGHGETTRIYLSLRTLGKTDEINYQLKSMDTSKRKLLTTIEAYRKNSKNLL